MKYNLSGKQINEWEVLEYDGKQMWKCRCSCGNVRSIHSRHLRTGRSKSCGHAKAFKDLTGQTFGEWEVLEYAGSSQWKCRCSCGKEAYANGYDLTSGKTKSCGHKFNKTKELTGTHIGDWEVIEYAGNNRWRCRCLCGTVKDILTQTLVNGTSKSCGHIEDISGKEFWNWTAIKYDGQGKWLCRCKCGTEQVISLSRLKSGDTKSCGCRKSANYTKTMLDKYHVYNVSQLHLTPEQIRMASTKDELYKVIHKIGSGATPSNLSSLLGLTATQTMRVVRKHGLEGLITFETETSQFENELYRLYPGAERSNRSILKGKEVDLYYPEYHIGIEFNGDYWHNEHMKPLYYHQAKTALAYKAGIDLIHIFEYEWVNTELRTKILKMLDRRLGKATINRLGARDCEVRHINSSDARVFLDKYHLQSYTAASISLGLCVDNSLIGIATFGKPRFNRDTEYELIRLAWHPDYIVMGGGEKLLKHFILEYNPKSIVSYCDISKFTGESYLRLGFKAVELTRPNYKWVNEHDHSVLTRYQTTKQSLIKNGLGTPDETEAEIMYRLGYYRIYDCGNIKFIWGKGVE